MVSKLKRYRLLMWIGVALAAGFMATSLVSYLVSVKTIRDGFSEQTLPLTGDTIYSEIQRDILRPVFISSLMAHDTFVRDWIIDGEKQPEQIERYLREIKQKYGVVTSFLVSEQTRKYYYAEGTLKSVQANEPRDAWYFRVRQLAQDYETNVDPDMANRDKMTIFINYRIKDYQGNFIAATGVGMTLDTMGHLIDSYQQRFRRNIYFVDQEGRVTLQGKSTGGAQRSIRDEAGIQTIAGNILNQKIETTLLEYDRESDTFLLSSRYIPELGWYLIVEQNISEEMKPLRRAFAVNMAISASIMFIVLVTILVAVQQYQRRLENMAATDTMTGLLNRHAFAFIFNQAVLDMQRSGAAMSAIVFDIDFFKQVNDTHGHLAGDQVLRDIADLSKSTVRESDVICRWGGEEFLILLKACPFERAHELAEKLRQAVAGHAFQLGELPAQLTISLGVSQYIPGESLSEFFSRADEGLYLAKHAGRNRIGVSAPTTVKATANETAAQ